MKNHENNHKILPESKHGLRPSKFWPMLLFMIILTVSGYSQEKRITLSLKNVGIEILLKEIQQQTGMDYIFNQEEIPAGTTISIQATNETVSEVLDKCFKNIELSYQIVDGVIVVVPKNQKELELSQVIRGRVVDAETEIPLAYASVAIVTTDPMMGAVSDENGYFRIEGVPIGRHDIKVSYMGYGTQIIPELMVTTGKEVVLQLKMKEVVSEMEAVMIKPRIKKDKALNGMSTVSARTFSVEEARRYAGGFDDPGRLAASFAGISTENSRDNTIIIRGNSPKGLLWRLEGIEISNPNHFANLATYGGGGISSLSALVLGNSDFFTGAFPAEYGNAMSGVFDLKLRNGNNEQFEHAFQLGTMGIDISSEGPLGKNTRASYLFNYRYSTMGLVVKIFPEELKSFMPVYQDLSFKVNLPTQKAGVFSLWGLASADKSDFPAKTDSAEWEITMDRLDNRNHQRMGAIGLNHRYIIGKKTWLNTTLALNGDYMHYEDDILDYNAQLHEYNRIDIINYKYTATSVLSHKFSAKHSNRTGIIIDKLNYDINIRYAPVIGQDLNTLADEEDASNKIQFFSQSKINLFRNFVVNAGLHGLYFELNREFVLEPRLGMTYSLNNNQSISLAYGKHSRIEPLNLYFARVDEGNAITQPNLDMKISKAHHIVLAYDISINPNLRLKVEPYIQYLYDIPVIPDSNYSVLNLETEWYYFNQLLVNTGTGKNIGIDVTLERFLKDGYYYLFTASLFDSKYKGDDGVEHNTRFNTRYVINFLVGKEWIIGSKRNQILGVNAKVNFFGGKRITPVNQEQSAIAEDVVYYYSRLFEDREQGKFHVNAAINYRINKKNHASIWSLQMMNVFVVSESYGYFYNYRSKRVEPWELAVPTPSLSYKIEF